MFKYRVQAIYNQFVTNEVEEQIDGQTIGRVVPSTEIDAYTVDFEDLRKDVAHRLANEEADRILRRGMTKRGGSIVRLVIAPSAILQVSVTDMQLYQKELEDSTLTP